MDNNFAHQDLRISLDSDPHDGSEQTSPYYAPGQAISGTAVYAPQAEVKIESMTVVFKATLYAEPKDNGQSSYGCIRTLNQNLFRYEKTILQGPHKLSPRQHTWPFTFDLPERVKVPFATEPQLAPPTWDVLQVARVVYSLRLCVNPNRKNRTMEIERTINVWPYRNIHIQPPEPVVHQLLNEEQKRNWKMLLSRTKSTETGSDIDISIHMPQTLGIWQSFPIHITCNRRDDTASPDANLVLDHCELALRAKAHYNASKTSTNTDQTQLDSLRMCKYKLRGQGLQMPLNGSPVLVKRDLRLADMTRGDATVLVPSFSISYLSLSYVMDVEVRLVDTVTGLTVERKKEIDFRILPSGLEPPIDVGDGVEHDAPPAFDEMAALPPDYESETVW